jgi:isoprenylcysteine carboxyl methyltransferase (ICMT) family protein YpbQ
MLTTLLGYVLLGVVSVSERFLRQGEEARSFETGTSDQGTTRLVGAAWAVGIGVGLLAPVLSRSGPGRISDTRLPKLGSVLMVLGLGLKWWAMHKIGRFYTRTLRAASDQPVVESGPYRYVRHPGYLGAVLMWIGFSLTTRQWLALLGITLAMLMAYTRRISSEETMLVQTLGEPYAAYQRRTARLLPGAY